MPATPSNRGDLGAVFALFDPEVEYGLPPACTGTIHCGAAPSMLAFWRRVFVRYGDSTIENLSVEEAVLGRIVRRARLRHLASPSGDSLSYAIMQTTELDRGRVVRQMNLPDPKSEGEIGGS